MDSKIDQPTSDLESAVPVSKPLASDKGQQVLEAAGLLTVWSLLVINEGAIRFMDTEPSVELFAAGEPSKFLVFLGGLFEVIFGLVGLGVGVAAFILRSYSTYVTKFAMILQTILGWYVFIIFVFVIPSFRASNVTEEVVLEGMSIGSTRFFIVLGILTSFHFCLALQGGQFLFMARLVTAATGDNFLNQRTGNSMRAVFWNGNLAFSGLWTLISGSIINAQVGGGRLDAPYVSPPNVGTVPGLTIVVGLVMILWGLVGIAISITKAAPMAYFVGTGFVYLLAMLNFGIAQFGTFGSGAQGGPVALHNGLVFMVVFLGPYFVLQAHKDHTQETA